MAKAMTNTAEAPAPTQDELDEKALMEGVADLLELSRATKCDHVTRVLRNLVDPDDKGEPITVAEAARMLGKHRSTVGRWIQEGLMPAMKLPNKTWGVYSRDVEKLMDICKVAQ